MSPAFLPFRDDEAARAEAFGKARYVCGQEALDIERGPWRIGYSQSHQLRSSLVSGPSAALYASIRATGLP